MSSENCYKGHAQKFKLKGRTREADAARLRENQRRHRARVKSRIEELETLLSTTQAKLDSALKVIETLTSEVQRLQRPLNQSISQTETPPSKLSLSTSEPSVPSATISEYHRSTPSSLEPILKDSDDFEKTPPSPPEDRQLEASRDLQNQGSDGSPSPDLNKPTDDCAFLPPPSPGESTMLCREAYSIIKQHLSEVDLETATESLKPGFRRAIIPGTGCRVQTQILFSFVDRIT